MWVSKGDCNGPTHLAQNHTLTTCLRDFGQERQQGHQPTVVRIQGTFSVRVEEISQLQPFVMVSGGDQLNMDLRGRDMKGYIPDCIPLGYFEHVTCCARLVGMQCGEKVPREGGCERLQGQDYRE
mmetsp:Transcript_33833/g.60668  ORF Transcript_33833/g.60668 Transcript_33833/m.60668 type:complete len:125 (+) Transcript_33833:137-511(+)